MTGSASLLGAGLAFWGLGVAKKKTEVGGDHIDVTVSLVIKETRIEVSPAWFQNGYSEPSFNTGKKQTRNNALFHKLLLYAGNRNEWYQERKREAS